MLKCIGSLHKGELLAEDNFWKSSENKSGYQRICKDCTKASEANRTKVELTEKTCRDCKILKPIAAFYRASRLKDNYRPECSLCTKARKCKNKSARTLMDPAVRRLKGKAWKYGITIEQYQTMGDSQNWQCKICQEATPLVVDHDHNCCAKQGSCGKCVRGLICSTCNIGLGMFKDSPNRLQAAYDYLLNNVS